MEPLLLEWRLQGTTSVRIFDPPTDFKVRPLIMRAPFCKFGKLKKIRKSKNKILKILNQKNSTKPNRKMKRSNNFWCDNVIEWDEALEHTNLVLDRARHDANQAQTSAEFFSIFFFFFFFHLRGLIILNVAFYIGKQCICRSVKG